MAYIKYDPYEPGGRERAYGRVFLSMFSFWGSLASIIYYISAFASLFEGKYSDNVYYSAGFLLLMAIIDFFMFTSQTDTKKKKELAKSYFLFFFVGAIVLIGIIAVVVVGRSQYNGNGTTLLIGSGIGVLIAVLVIVLLCREIGGYEPVRIKLFTDKNVSSRLNSMTTPSKESAQTVSSVKNERNYIFCHKCGKKLLDDSKYCSSCGAKLK